MSELLVVGGTSGLGLEFVKARISAGDKVVVVSRKEFKLNGVTSIICDLSDAEEVGFSIKRLLRSKLNFDSLLFFQRSRKGSYEDSWQSEFDVAVSSTRQFLQSSQSMLRNDGDKSIVIVNSIASTFISRDATDGYQISKAALLHLARYYAVVLGNQGIRINTVTPFAFVKEISKDFFESNQDWNKIIEKRIPLRRICTPEDIINLIDFLRGKQSNYITGQEVIIDGGLSLSLGVDLN
jgi:NAD(P)-dependent dehydrogenase (short-subunit alcohol dehydrogenase family)